MKSILTLLLCYTFFLGTPTVSAENSQNFSVYNVLSDGRNGRVWRQWRQKIKEDRVYTVIAVLKRRAGGDDTFVTLRFGSEQAFENGKQVFLKSNKQQEVSWNVGGKPPLGRFLVLNAYKGEVFLSKVSVIFTKGKNPNADTSSTDSTREEQKIGKEDPKMKLLCREAARIKAPHIELNQLQPTETVFSGKYIARGSMFGSCVQEAGYYENGRLKKNIRFRLDIRYTQRKFDLAVQSGKNGELRIYNTAGGEDIISIDKKIAEKKSRFR